MAKAAYWTITDVEARKRGEQTGLDTLAIMGDTAMCINPNDPKNEWLKGKKVIVPLVNRACQTTLLYRWQTATG